jgi:hypothetical protein
MDSVLSMGETALWRSVIARAFHDATLHGIAAAESTRQRAEGWTLTKDQQRDCEKARQWLLSSGWDFNLVCHLADLDPSAVREAAVRAIADSPDQRSSIETRTGQRMQVFSGGETWPPTLKKTFNHWKAKMPENAGFSSKLVSEGDSNRRARAR